MSEEREPEPPTPNPEGEGVKLYPCQYCGRTQSDKYGLFDSPIKLASHTKYECEAAKEHKETEGLKEARRKVEAAKEVARNKEEDAAPLQPGTPTSSTSTPQPEELTPYQRVSLYGKPELDKIKKESLEKFLTAAPNVSKKLSDWILQQWDMDSNVREDPNDLSDLLHDAGIPNHIAHRAVNLLISIEDEMHEVLERDRERPTRYGRGGYRNREESERRYDYTRRRPLRDDTFVDGRPHLREIRPGVYEEDTYEPRHQPLSSTDDVSWRIEREVDRATKPLMDKMDKLTEELKDQKKPQQEQTVEIWRPKTDNDGAIMTDSGGKPILERIVVPASMADRFIPREDPELAALKKIEYMRSLSAPQGNPSSGEEITIEKIREVIKAEKEVLTADKVSSIIEEKMRNQQPGVNPDMQKMQDKIDAITTELGSTKDKMTQDRFDALNKQIEEMKGLVRGINAGTGYKEDSMRILATSLDKATEIAKERKPLERVLETMLPGGVPAIPPESQPQPRQPLRQPAAPTPVSEEAKKGPLTTMQKLGEQGYVVKK